MHVITRKRLNEFAEKFPETSSALAQWHQQMKQNDFDSIAEIRAIFPSADKVGKLTVSTSAGIKFVLSRQFIIIEKRFIFARF